MKEPTEAELERVAFVLMQFVEPWALPLNPENLDLMAYCALKHGLNSRGDWSELQDLVAGEIQRDSEQHERMLDARREAARSKREAE